MSYTVYILYSEKDGKLYTGCTSNIARRLLAHNKGLVFATCFRRPLVLIHQEKYINKTTAFARERFLKSLWAGRLKKRILSEYLNRAKP